MPNQNIWQPVHALGAPSPPESPHVRSMLLAGKAGVCCAHTAAATLAVGGVCPSVGPLPLLTLFPCCIPYIPLFHLHPSCSHAMPPLHARRPLCAPPPNTRSRTLAVPLGHPALATPRNTFGLPAAPVVPPQTYHSCRPQLIVFHVFSTPLLPAGPLHCFFVFLPAPPSLLPHTPAFSCSFHCTLMPLAHPLSLFAQLQTHTKCLPRLSFASAAPHCQHCRRPSAAPFPFAPRHNYQQPTHFPE